MVPFLIACHLANTCHHPPHVVTWPTCTDHIWTSVSTTSAYTSEAEYHIYVLPDNLWMRDHTPPESINRARETIQLPGELSYCLKVSRPQREHTGKDIYQEHFVTFVQLWHLLMLLLTTGFTIAHNRSVWNLFILIFFSFRFCTRISVV